jgi:hypothetical protein
LALIYGLVEVKHKVALKKHGSPEMSLFRWGLDKWQAYLSHLEDFMENLQCFTNNWFTNNYPISNSPVP